MKRAIVFAALYFGQRWARAVCPAHVPKAGGIDNLLQKLNIIAVILVIIAMILWYRNGVRIALRSQGPLSEWFYAVEVSFRSGLVPVKPIAGAVSHLRNSLRT